MKSVNKYRCPGSLWEYNKLRTYILDKIVFETLNFCVADVYDNVEESIWLMSGSTAKMIDAKILLMLHVCLYVHYMLLHVYMAILNMRT